MHDTAGATGVQDPRAENVVPLAFRFIVNPCKGIILLASRSPSEEGPQVQ